ncbi:hypothetical protein V8C86DRAFT_1124168 [Haematococcus lacustris]
MQRAVRLVAQSGAIDVEEMLEAVEFVERVRRRVRRSHMLDLAAGHGLVGLLLLAVNPQVQSVTFVDRAMPASFESLYAALASDPSLGVNLDRVTYFQCDVHELASAVETSSQSRNPWAAQRTPVVIEDVEQLAGQLLLWGRGNALGVVAVHACGALTDSVLVLASLAQAPVAVMPCCYSGTARGTPQAWRRSLGVAMAADMRRSYGLWDAGYECVDFSAVPRAITPANRIIVASSRQQQQQQQR